MTFSIVAFDPENGDLGVAVASKFPAVGAVVPWARAGVGGVATQSWANTDFGPDGLGLMGGGMPAAAALDAVLEPDDEREERQVGFVDANGGVASFTGANCMDWAGGVTGDGFAAQGNILAGEAVVNNMVDAFEKTEGHLELKLLAALDGGQAGGGDSRGMQSAAMIIVKKNGGVWLHNDTMLRLQVDDNPEPIKELRRLVERAARQLASDRNPTRRP
jgi:uncharacterized Ntn-hydrolase superfamily protein